MRLAYIITAIVLIGFAGGPLVFAGATPASEETLVSGIDGFKPSGSQAAEMGRFSTIAVTGQSFDTALRAQTDGSPLNRWDVMLQAPVSQAVATGDCMLLRFWVRTEEAMAADGVVGAAVELNHEPWEKLAQGQYGAPRQWTQIQLPFAARHAFDAATLNVSLCLGYSTQTLDIGGIELTRFPPGTQVDTLPRTSVTYHGMEPDAPWRRDALERIERIRKGNLQVVLHDHSGKPVADRAVHIKLTRHAFHFGTAVDAKLMLASSDAADQYRAHLASNFNTVVYENDLKWLSLGTDPNRYTMVDNTLPWFASRNIDVRGHVLVWPALKWLPPEIRALESDPPALRQAVNDHITSLVTRYSGRLKEWDVLNEPYNNRDLEKLLGREAYVDWFKLARAADPQAKLFINDFGILESDNRIDTDHQKHYEGLIQYLLSSGAPIDGIGIQGHFGSLLTDPEKMLAILDRFGQFGKPIRITELDVNMLDPLVRANFLRDVLIVCFSHPSVDGIMQWGFWEGRHWMPDAALYARNWDLRQHGQAWKELMERWTTDVAVVTASDGTATLRGFLGDYELQSGDTNCQASLLTQGTCIEMTVDP